MSDETVTVTQSALRGIACRCPRCGRGKLYAGFLTLRPRCESCGLDYAFIDIGDGPAIFIIMGAGAKPMQQQSRILPLPLPSTSFLFRVPRNLNIC